jgi:hypothetical protein
MSARTLAPDMWVLETEVQGQAALDETYNREFQDAIDVG